MKERWNAVIRLSIATLLVAVFAATAKPSQGGQSAQGPAGLEAATPEEELFSAIDAGDATRVSEQLARAPELLRARRKGMSVVMAALFVRRNGFLFTPPDQNSVLRVVLARHPVLDIFEASATGSLPRMRRLLASDASRARAWDRGWTALHLAAFGGSARAVELLLHHGADLHARTQTRFRLTPLLAALLNGQYQTSKLLLERGANVLDQQVSGGTALHEAAFSCRRDLVGLLLAHGAELNARSNSGETPLSEARRGKCDEVARLLAARGALE